MSNENRIIHLKLSEKNAKYLRVPLPKASRHRILNKIVISQNEIIFFRLNDFKVQCRVHIFLLKSKLIIVEVKPKKAIKQ